MPALLGLLRTVPVRGLGACRPPRLGRLAASPRHRGGQALLEQQRAVAEAQVKAERDARIETERRMAALKGVTDEADRRARPLRLMLMLLPLLFGWLRA